MRLIDSDLLKANCKCTGELKDHFEWIDLLSLTREIDRLPAAYETEDVDVYKFGYYKAIQDFLDEVKKTICKGII